MLGTMNIQKENILISKTDSFIHFLPPSLTQTHTSTYLRARWMCRRDGLRRGEQQNSHTYVGMYGNREGRV